jgi:hypothetical protein
MKLRTVLCLLLASVACGVSRAQDVKQSLSVAYPGKTWEVRIDSPGFVVQANEQQPAGRQYLLASDTTSGLVLSVMLEATGGPADASTCADSLKHRVDSFAKLGPVDVKASEVKSMAAIEFMFPVVSGVPIRQKNFWVCTARENVFIDLHLSKVQFHASDESLFMDVVNQFSIQDRKAPAAEPPNGTSGKSSMEYFGEGSGYYLANDFTKAIGPYESALALEKQHRSLSQNNWRVLVDNLGMAYGISGDLQHSETTLNYGISEDPGYPMFYYNLGCVAAERGDLDKTMDFLSKAFARKANSIPGEGLPDPRKDDSFQRFMSNDQFRKFADSLEAAQ